MATSATGSAYLQPPPAAVTDAVARALAEDLLPLGDLTSMLLPDGLRARASFAARGAGVLAGTACATEAFAQVDPSVSVTWGVAEGSAVAGGDVLGTVEGLLASILTGERTALNFLSHLSGVATRTRRFVEAAAATGGTAQVWDTRKTTPGLRTLEKAAVRAGGGVNHRGNLSDWILLKDNHIARFGIGDAITTARRRWPGRTVHIECDRIEQLREALDAGVDAVLLDNMTPDEVRACVTLATEHARSSGRRRPLLEASGGVDLETIGTFSTTGVDYISVGSITNSAPVLDIGLDIETS